MRRLLFVLAVLALAFEPEVKASCSRDDSPGAFDFEAITVSNASIGFTAAKIIPATGQVAFAAYCVLQTNPINFRTDGGAPTAAVGGGLAVAAAQTVEVCGNKNVENFRAIRTGAADGTLSCLYFR